MKEHLAHADPAAFTPWIRGVLDAALLGLVARGESYGYDLSRQLDGAGLGRIPGGSLYPALRRLESNGLVASRWEPGQGGPGRKLYTITEEGVNHLDSVRAQWDHFAHAISSVLAPHQGTRRQQGADAHGA